MKDVEGLIEDHIAHTQRGTADSSRLRLLVPSVGTFFTPLPLQEAFCEQDNRRHISSRRFVAPSFNDVRLILNTAQVKVLAQKGVKLITFDGDVTLYDDGETLLPENKVISRILALLQRGINVGIVTAAGYPDRDGHQYAARLYGLLDAVMASTLSVEHKQNLVLLGGECNYMFRFHPDRNTKWEWQERDQWLLEEMRAWSEDDISLLLDNAQASLQECMESMDLPAQILRKERAVGIIPDNSGRRFSREQLEETVLVAQKNVDFSEVARRIPFCAFNGGNDVFIDIGDKRYGVMALQKYFGDIQGHETLHVGDQFLSVGHNDFKARLACTTVWISSPAETVQLLDELVLYLDHRP